MTLTDLESLARAATQAEPSDHGKLSSTRMAMWVDALNDFNEAANPERVLALIAIVRAADAMRNFVPVGNDAVGPGIVLSNTAMVAKAYDAARAAWGDDKC
jgi:hypothetical protein